MTFLSDRFNCLLRYAAVSNIVSVPCVTIIFLLLVTEHAAAMHFLKTFSNIFVVDINHNTCKLCFKHINIYAQFYLYNLLIYISDIENKIQITSLPVFLVNILTILRTYIREFDGYR